MMGKIIIALQLSLMLISINVFSQTSEKSLMTKLLIEGGIEYGGDEVLNGYFTNSGDDLLKAGQGIYLAVGGQLEFRKVKYLMFRGSVGFKYHTASDDNANVRLTRIPVNLIPYLKIKNDFRIGVGITLHKNIKLRGEGLTSDSDFTSSGAPRFEFGYKWLAISYSSIKYIAETDGIYSASSVGLSASFTFPK